MASFQSITLKECILISSIKFASVSECLVWFSLLSSLSLFVYFYILQSNYYRSFNVIAHIIHFRECILPFAYFEFEDRLFSFSSVLLGPLDFLILIMFLKVHVLSHFHYYLLFDVQILSLFIYSTLIFQKESYYLLQSFRILI